MRAWLARGGGARTPAAFLDRDGTLNRNRHGAYVTREDQLELYARVPAGLKLLAQKGYRLVVLTNQSGIARGYMSEAGALRINRKLVKDLAAAGVKLDAVYYCPHGPDDGCSCRKPRPGLLKEAVRDLPIDLSRSFVAGDKRSDLELARRAGLDGRLVLTGGGRAAAKAAKNAYRDIYSLALAAKDLREEK